jgi:uncharacterized RDD family membrane protein YckC
MDPQTPGQQSEAPSAAPSYAPPAPAPVHAVGAGPGGAPDLPKRAIAAIIDFVAIGIVQGILGMVLGIPLGWVGAMAAAAVGCALLLGRDVLYQGKSPGKHVMGLGVVRADGGAIGPNESIKRNATLAIGTAGGILGAIPVLGLLAIPIYLLGFAVCLYELYLVATGQPRLGDKLAGGTHVISQGKAVIAM